MWCRQRYLLGTKRAQGIQIHDDKICLVEPNTDPIIAIDIGDKHNSVLISAAPVAASV